MKLEKCVFDKPSLEYFGYIFSADGMKPSPAKIEALKDMNRPTDLKSLRSFLGMINYLKRFIPDYSSITYPLRQLTQKDAKFSWSEDWQQAFIKLTTTLTEKSCLSYFDGNKETLVYCDASPVGISAILLQQNPDKTGTKVVTYASRSLSQT